jgi:hypothetical protein
LRLAVSNGAKKAAMERRRRRQKQEVNIFSV